MRIGFIGLGIMGSPMALHLHEAGHQLLVPERPSLRPEIRAVAQVLDTPHAIAAACEVLVLMLPDTPDVEQVLFGTDGAAAGLGNSDGTAKLVIDMSTISPLATRDFAARITAAGAEYLDAPVSGGEVGARQASLGIMVGGPDASFARALPLFEKLGKTIVHVGPAHGDGQVCKAANQIMVALHLQAAAEALVFASRMGTDPARVRQALLGGFAASRVLEVHGQRMLDGSFNPGFRIKLHQKDLDLALSAGRAEGIALPATAMVQQMFAACVAAGAGGLDHSALVRATETLAQTSLRAPKPV
jgi:2-hydroxy-3-oxopropionate reductase